MAWRRLLPLAALLVACQAAEPSEVTPADGASELTDVSPTTPKRQSTPTCWLYSMATFAEAMHLRATNQELDLSEAYWTYWHWYDQLTGGVIDYAQGKAVTLDTSGNWPLAAELIARYGWMHEADFLPEEAGLVRSQRAFDALTTIEAALQPGGELHGDASREPAHVLDVLDRAWRLSPAVVREMRAVFDPARERDLRDPALAATARIHRSRELAANDGLTLEDVLGSSPVLEAGQNVSDAPRQGPHAWTVITTSRYDDTPESAQRNRIILKLVQATLHSHRPVYMLWAADDRHIDASGTFRADVQDPTATAGYKHLSVITDYEVADVPGFGTLPAGVLETRPEALQAAFDDRAKVRFFRIKNPWWGSYPKDGTLIPFTHGTGGYNDLDLDYLSGDELGWRRMRQVVLPADLLGSGG